VSKKRAQKPKKPKPVMPTLSQLEDEGDIENFERDEGRYICDESQSYTNCVEGRRFTWQGRRFEALEYGDMSSRPGHVRIREIPPDEEDDD
jgi:hypothetical protein